MPDGARRAERFLDHLDTLTGGVEPVFYPVPSTQEDLPRVVNIQYAALPEPHLTTSFTYGLSVAEHDEWRLGRPELCTTVASTDLTWGIAAATVAERLRGRCAFSYGDTIDFGEPISSESSMTAFVIFVPMALDRDSYLDIDVGDQLPVSIAGCYPLHEVERQFVDEHGLEQFWRNVEWDPLDVRRKPAV